MIIGRTLLELRKNMPCFISNTIVSSYGEAFYDQNLFNMFLSASGNSRARINHNAEFCILQSN